MFFGRKKRRIEKLLLVEDEPLVAFDNEHVLTDAGYTIVATTDRVSDAVECIASGKSIDLVLVETLSDLGEADAALAAAREVAPDLPVVVTMSFDTNLRTMMGVRPADAVTHLAAAGADAVGANCGRGPEEMEVIAAEMVAARPEGLLIVAQSNAGLPQVVGDHFEYDASPEELADHARALRDLGVDLVGACCGSTPEHIAAMGRALSA